MAVALSLHAGHAAAQTATPPVLDDGYTWLSVEDNPRNNPIGNEGWRLVARLRMFGSAAADSAFRLVVRRGNREVAQARCPGRADPLGMSIERCGGSDSEWTGAAHGRVPVAGDYTVDVKYVNGQTDQEILLRTMRFSVGEAGNVSEGNFRPEPSRFYLNADGRLLDTIIHRVAANGNTYIGTGGIAFSNANTVELVVVTSPRDLGSSMSSNGNSMRCAVDGQPVAIDQDQTTGTVDDRSWADGSRRPTTGNERVRERFDWRRIAYRLPLTWGTPTLRRPRTAVLDEHPGTWQCELRQDGQTLRVFRFTVGADGSIAAHAEESAGLHLLPEAHLVETYLTNAPIAQDRPYQAGALRAGGFYGREWGTPAGRAMAAAALRPPPALTAGATAPAGSAAAPPAAGAGPAVRYDDGYAWFEARNHVEPVNGSPTNAGWSIEGAMRVLGTFPNRSAFRIVLKQGTRTLGEVRCEARQVEREGAESFAYAEYCGHMDDSHVGGPQRILATGDVTAEVYFVDGSTDQSSLVRTHRLRIYAATGVRGNNQADATNYYVSHNAEALASMIETVPRRMIPFVHSNSTRTWDQAFSVYLITNVSPAETPTFGNSLRCRVNDQPVELRNVQADAQTTEQVTTVHTRSSGTANPTREVVNYRRVLIELPLTYGPAGNRHPDREALESHPGAWACDWRSNGQTLRTFRFTVNADGAIAAHPEEAAGLILGPRVHLVETVIPAANPMDVRVDPAAARAGAFYGRAWVSEPARTMAAAVPAIGTPAPPQPSGGAGAAAGPAAPRGRRR